MDASLSSVLNASLSVSFTAKHCASKSETETAVLYLPNNDFNEADMSRAIRRYNGLRNTLGDDFKDFNAIYVISNKTVYKMK